MKYNLDSINKAFENRIRLGIMSVLIANESVDFVSLKSLLDLTDGNLASHTRSLEELAYIRSHKQFIGRKPNTTYSITDNGRDAFISHINALETLLNNQLNTN
jgi:DNA-binding transcriptional ArsR family regulator